MDPNGNDNSGSPQNEDTAKNTSQAILNEDLSFAENWTENLPEDIKSDPTLQNVRTLPGAMKSLIHAQKMVGADKIAVPPEGADESYWDEVYRKLGRPDTPDEYGLEKPEGWPEDAPYDEGMAKEFAEVAHKNGLLPNQLKGIMDWYNQKGLGQFQQSQQARQEAYRQAAAKLKSKWGQKYDEKVNRAEQLVQAKASDEAKQVIAEKFRNEPALIELLANIADDMSEDTFKAYQPQGFTPTEAQTEINKIMGDKNNPYWNSKHPQHAEMVQKVQKLYESLNTQ